MSKKYLVIGALAAAIMGVGVYQYTDAYRGDPSVKGPNYSEARHEQMQTAFENKDYNAWKNLMQDRGRVTQVVNEGNFARFAEMHQLMLEGKIDQANKIRQELGLGQQGGSGKRMGRGMKAGGCNGNCKGNFVDANKDGVCDNRK